MRGFRILATVAVAFVLTAGLVSHALGDCGNGVIDPGEECDSGRLLCSGGLNPLQSCSTAAECFGGTCVTCDVGISCTNGGNRDDLVDKCRSDCTLPHCGDGVKDTGEACDDGNAVNTDGCTNACKLPACGDGFAQAGAGEQCDDGNLTNNDGCSATCQLEKCGDGTRQASEGCDAGQAVCQAPALNAGAKCSKNSECFGGNCGSGNRDDLPNVCRSNCTLPHCGDSVTDMPEMCDDGNTVNTDTCTNNCKNPVCGDGFVQGSEKCDDGNTVNGDGCSSTCQPENCGDGTKQATEKCDLGDAKCQPPALNAGNVCTSNSDCFGGSCGTGNRNDLPNTCRAGCVLPKCGDGVQDAGEQCDDGNTSNTDGCTNTCKLPTCGDTFVQAPEKCDDGNTVSGDGCSATCQLEMCGDGSIKSPPEKCDQGQATCQAPAINAGQNCSKDSQCPGGACGTGNRDDVANRCRSNCDLPHCGDGVQDAGEQCDDGNTVNTDSCTNACKNPACGDGFVQGTEQCDDGNTVSGDGCNGTCQLEHCGDGVKQSPAEKCDLGTAKCQAPAVNAGDNCTKNADCFGGPCGGVGNRDDVANTCRSNCQPFKCGDGVQDAGELCDDGNTSNNDACTNDCKPAACGDGFVRTGVEKCDDGNTVSGDGCTATCMTEVCGDGITQTALGEECDLGDSTCQAPALNAGDTCATAAECIGGPCSTKNRDDVPNTCRTNCKLPSCGDGVQDTGELCDDGNQNNTDACTNDCKTFVCGDGFVHPPNETCDDGNTVNGDGCSASCQIEKCGDGVIQGPTEQCDPPSATCTNGCCYIGPVGPAPITSIGVGFDTLCGCHMAKLCAAAASCGTRVVRLCQHAWQRCEQARVFFSTSRNTRSISRLNSQEKLLERLARMIGRSSVTCQNEPAINDQAARAGDMTNELKNAIQF